MIQIALALTILAADPQPDDGPQTPTLSDVDTDMKRGVFQVFMGATAVACHMRTEDWQKNVIQKVAGMVGYDIMATNSEQPLADRIQWLKDKIAAANLAGSHPTPDDCHSLGNGIVLKVLEGALKNE